MVSKERDRARRNRQRFQQLLNELEQQDHEIADLYEDAGVEPQELSAAPGTDEGSDAPVPSQPPEPRPQPVLRGFVVRG